MNRIAILAIALTACGRIGFDETSSVVDGNDAPVAMTCPAGALLCDDFESGTTGQWSGTLVYTNASLDVSSALVHGGMYALDARVSPQAPGAASAVRLDLTPRSGVIAVRVFASSSLLLYGYNSVIVLYGTNQYVLQAGAADSWKVTEDYGNGTIDHDGADDVIETTWTCLELVVDARSPGPSFVELFVNDTSVLSTTLANPDARLDELQVGAARADGGGFAVVVDDVVVANQRIGCQ